MRTLQQEPTGVPAFGMMEDPTPAKSVADSASSLRLHPPLNGVVVRMFPTVRYPGAMLTNGRRRLSAADSLSSSQ